MSTPAVQYQTVNPATGEVVETFSAATDADCEAALANAASAYDAWRRCPLAQRAAVLTRTAELVRERIDELATLATEEMGKSRGAARGELGLVADIFDYYATHGPEMLADEEYAPASGGRAIIRRNPVGVLLGIMPWNYPYYQVARFVAPNLLLGNTTILKHAPSCPKSALALAAVLHDAGLPDGAYINIFASNDQIAAMIADDRLQGVSLTGSERAGAAVAEIAGRHLKKVVLELGGSDPMIILDSADVAASARTAYGSRMANRGQACNSPKRMLVPSSLYDDFVTEIVALATADPNDTPLSSRAAAEGVHRQIERAVDQGATLHVGGALSEVGAFLSPAVLTGVTPEMDLYYEEVFGPVVVVHEVRDADHAVEMANDSVYGLGAAIFGSDEDEIMRVADQLDCGMVFVNSAEDSEPDLPFGGMKRSGFGRELSHLAIDEFANLKLIRLP